MKKHSKLFFIISVTAQFISYIGAALMFFKKNKPAAGFLAAIGLVGTIFGLAALDMHSEGNKKKLLNVKTRKTETAEVSSDPVIDTEAEEKALFDSIEFDADELDAAPLNYAEAKKQNDEMERISDAIEILKGTTPSFADEDIEAELNKE